MYVNKFTIFVFLLLCVASTTLAQENDGLYQPFSQYCPGFLEKSIQYKGKTLAEGSKVVINAINDTVPSKQLIATYIDPAMHFKIAYFEIPVGAIRTQCLSKVPKLSELIREDAGGIYAHQ